MFSFYRVAAAVVAMLIGSHVVRAEGTFHIFNTVEKKSSFQVKLTEKRTGRRAQSRAFLGFQNEWTVALSGGMYRVELLHKNGVRDDLGWFDFGDMDEGYVYLGWSDRAWRLEKRTNADGSTKMVWTMRLVYGDPPSRGTPRRKITAAVESEIADEWIDDGLEGPDKSDFDDGLLLAGDARDIRIQAVPNRPRFGITATKCTAGIHVQSVAPNSAATRCIDVDTGAVLQLEAGDHIVSVNGIEPASLEQFLNDLAASPREMSLIVSDARTGEVRRMQVTLGW